MVDITDRRAAHEARRHSEELYRLVIESTHDLITLVDADGVLRYVSPSVEALQGWTPEEVIGRRWSDDVHPEDAATVDAYVRSRRAGKDLPPPTARIRHKNGSWITLEGSLSPTTSPDGAITGFVGVSRPLQRPTLRPAAS
jgi:PAS domain S-box-containing protein